jgi:hypothetical protein
VVSSAIDDFFLLHTFPLYVCVSVNIVPLFCSCNWHITLNADFAVFILSNIIRKTRITIIFIITENDKSRFRWPQNLRRGPAVARLLRLSVRIPPRAWRFFCVLSGRGHCFGLITRLGEPYRVCVSQSVIRYTNNSSQLKWLGRGR